MAECESREGPRGPSPWLPSAARGEATATQLERGGWKPGPGKAVWPRGRPAAGPSWPAGLQAGGDGSIWKASFALTNQCLKAKQSHSEHS